MPTLGMRFRKFYDLFAYTNVHNFVSALSLSRSISVYFVLIMCFVVGLIARLSLYINFNNAIEAKVHRDSTLDEFKTYIFDKLMPCKNPKIYFNGLLLKDGAQSLAKYGVTNQSSLYINTEKIAGGCQFLFQVIKCQH